MSFIERSLKTMGGVAVLRGTRFPVAQFIGELCDGDDRSVREIADNFDLDYDIVIGALLETARGLG